MSLSIFLFCLFLAIAFAGLGTFFSWLEERNESDLKRASDAYGSAHMEHWD